MRMSLTAVPYDVKYLFSKVILCFQQETCICEKTNKEFGEKREKNTRKKKGNHNNTCYTDVSIM